jgi:histidine kinase 2/3/4 (cytokinin receptor)
MHFEKQHGWTIKKMEAENEALIQDCIPENLDPAPIQDEYAPVIFAQETISHIVSIDMMSGKVCLSSLVITPRPITLYFLQSYFEAVP